MTIFDHILLEYLSVNGCFAIKEKPLPHRPRGRKAKTLDFRHNGGTHCRCDFCITPYNRAHSKRSADAEISAYFKELS